MSLIHKWQDQKTLRNKRLKLKLQNIVIEVVFLNLKYQEYQNLEKWQFSCTFWKENTLLKSREGVPHINLDYQYSFCYWSSYTTAFIKLPKIELPKLPPPCGVSLPQHNLIGCKILRNIPVDTNKLIYRLKPQDELNGFALLSTNPIEMRLIALADPFMSDYTHHYLLQAADAIGSVVKYGLTNNLKKEINDISEYQNLTNWFQDTMENKGLVNTRLFCVIYN